MSIAASVGRQGLLQLRLSLGDVALVYSQGRKFGNWLSCKRNEEDLFETLMEDPEAILKRKGLVEPARMESLYPSLTLIHEGQKVDSQNKTLAASARQDLQPFSWLMVVLVAALDICLPHQRILDLIIDVFLEVLNNTAAEDSLRVSLDVNIQSWRSVSQVRRVAPYVRATFKKTWQEKSGGLEAIPQLSQAEAKEMVSFLTCLFSGIGPSFTCISAATFAAARAIEKAGIFIHTTERSLGLEGPLHVLYLTDKSQWQSWTSHHPHEHQGPFDLQRGLVSRAQMISYPVGKPESMIKAMQAKRETLNQMAQFWEYGKRAAGKFCLRAKASLPYTRENEFYYELDGSDPEHDTFDACVSIIAGKAFPCASQTVSMAVETLLQGKSTTRKEWLETHAGLEYLEKSQSTLPSRRSENMEAWLVYQALVFGFFYKLMEPLVVLDFLSGGEVYFQGLWGYGSTTFLAMCTRLGHEIRMTGRVTRTQVLYMISTMYGGRQKMFSNHTGRNLMGVLGPISVLALPLARTTDVPQDLAKYALLDLPVVQIVSDEGGEIYAGVGSGITFSHGVKEAKTVRPRGPDCKWSVHPTMRKAFREGGSGIVMAARCQGHLVGWFSPAAPEILFLSEAYQQKQHETGSDKMREAEVQAVEVLDKDWQNGSIWRPLSLENGDNSFGVIHSRGCPAMRYSAAGFYGAAGEEVSIATDDVTTSFHKLEAQGSGVMIS
ncbi:putative Heterokaryon incompatibility domain-containing protein [Seiridium cardinale]|uniref:Heterokaryon incompatibility domain-containing protein n=1 Tax=Seiridium cardinale TaxID=138064 RepID=A0ABR2XJS9_9PEZI